MKLTYNYEDSTIDIESNQVTINIGFHSLTLPVNELQTLIDLTSFIKGKESQVQYELSYDEFKDVLDPYNKEEHF